MKFRFSAVAVFLLCSLAVVAAERAPLVIGPKLYQGPQEKAFIELEQSIPGFAGWYFERDGSAVVMLKDTARSEQAIEQMGRVLEERAQRQRGRRSIEPQSERRIEARPALYSFSELASIRYLIKQRLPKGVYTIDVDEVRNVVRFGVRDETVARQVRAVAARFGVPDSALRVDVTEEPQLRSSLNDYHRPIRSGLGVYSNGGNCSVGINAIWNNDPTWVGFFTASHCSTRYVVDGTVFYQGGYRVGYEADDVIPTSFPGCPTGELCRYADAAWVAYDYADRATNNGENTLALPSWASYGAPGGTDYTGVYTIAGEALPYPVYNDPIFKVGRTTGWTYGYLTGTCEDVSHYTFAYNGQTVRFLCQERSDVYSEPGDSGSGVFEWDYVNGQYVARFTGILWGGPNRLESWHSSSWNIGIDFPLYSFYY